MSANHAKMTFRFGEPQEEILSSNNTNKLSTIPASEPVYDQSIPDSRGLEPERFSRISEQIDFPIQAEPVDWGDPFQDQHPPMNLPVQVPETLHDEEFYYKPPSRGSGWKLVGSVTGAIVTGLMFGYVVLSIFNKDIPLPMPGITSVQTNPSSQTQEEAVPVMGQVNELGTDTLQTVQVALPEKTFYFLQYGVFSSSEGVALAQKELEAQGIAAAPDTRDSKRVYAGISTDREQAKLLSGQLRTEGVNLILHEFSMPSTAEIAYDGDIQALEGYARDSVELVKVLSSLSASLLMEEAPKLPEKGTITELKDRHQRFTEQAAAIRSHFGTEDKSLVETMEKEMNSSIEALDQFGRNGAKAHLWEIQAAMMRYVLAEEQLFGQS